MGLAAYRVTIGNCRSLPRIMHQSWHSRWKGCEVRQLAIYCGEWQRSIDTGEFKLEMGIRGPSTDDLR